MGDLLKSVPASRTLQLVRGAAQFVQFPLFQQIVETRHLLRQCRDELGQYHLHVRVRLKLTVNPIPRIWRRGRRRDWSAGLSEMSRHGAQKQVFVDRLG